MSTALLSDNLSPASSLSDIPVTSQVPQTAASSIDPSSPNSAVHSQHESGDTQVSSHASPPITPKNSLPSLPPKIAPQRTHPMITRSQNNIFKPKKLFAATKHPLPSDIELTSATLAIKFPEWKEAMMEELQYD
ncbi:hypothetical protein COLO4_03359 [Corchorus olitorius]|uniref:Uncharacterized protein n=1 Tax=Corchorus olitorius TaxID=93759 RepID=A0A1R3KZ09_9ROSI|nr:hypothetical protein COLO4_03359 [Corchorus olitorius]